MLWYGMVCLQAEQKMLAAGYNKEYLPIEGLDAFRQATVQLLLGSNSAAVKEGRVAVIQVRRLHSQYTVRDISDM
jgi:aspartate aminotransferase